MQTLVLVGGKNFTSLAISVTLRHNDDMLTVDAFMFFMQNMEHRIKYRFLKNSNQLPVLKAHVLKTSLPAVAIPAPIYIYYVSGGWGEGSTFCTKGAHLRCGT